MSDHHRTLELLAQTMRKLRAAYDREATRHGVTLARVQVLSGLMRHEGATQAELAEQLGMEQPSLKAQIDALVADALVERRPHPVDRRKRTLHVTELGHASPLNRFILETRGLLLQDLPPEDLDALMRCLHGLNANIARIESR